MTLDILIPAFVTLFVIIDPIGLAPVFLALTRDMTSGHRRIVGLRAVLVAAAILTVFGLAGQAVLDLFGISMAAFRILDPADDPSVFPLAMPLISGPGAMATMILLMGNASDVGGKLAVLGVMIAVLAVVFAFFLAAGWLGRYLKDTGINVVTRLLGMLLAALAIQFMIDGLAQTPLFAV